MRPPRVLIVVGILALIAIAAVLSLSPRVGPATATGGNSVTSPDTNGNVGIDTSLALDGSGNPVVSYCMSSQPDSISCTSLKVMHCNDPDCAGGDESITSPDTSGSVGWDSSLALDAEGNPVVTYFDNSGGDLKVMHCNDPNCAGGDESITSPDIDGRVGQDNSLVLDASGNPVVSHWDDTNRDLKLVHCNDADCAGGDESITSPDTDNAGPTMSLTLDASGNPVVSYRGTFDLKLLHCNDPNCAGGDDSITTPDTGAIGDHGTESSIKLDASGNPVVSYIDGNGLRVLHCNDPNCAGGDESIKSPDTNASYVLETSLALDGSGNPVVSYSAPGSGLKLLHCNDPNCSGGDESISSPDTGGSVGDFSSLALDASGNPVVSYYDWTNRDLKVLHCSDPDCTKATPTPTVTPTPCGSQGCPVPLGPAVGVGSAFIDVGDQGKANVEALNIGLPGLGSWTIDVSYDPAVVSLISCAAAVIAEVFIDCNSAFTADQIRLIGFVPVEFAGTALVGDTVLGSLTFRCDSAGISGLGINSETLNFLDYTPGDPQPIAKAIQYGSITCVELAMVTPTPTKQPNGDTDNDGCLDTRENGLDETLGGRRDDLNFWDFFDPNRDLSVTLLDFLAVLGRFNSVGDAGVDPLSDPPPSPAYHPRFDRGGQAPGGDPWDELPADGSIGLADFLSLLRQFGHTCA